MSGNVVRCVSVKERHRDKKREMDRQRKLNRNRVRPRATSYVDQMTYGRGEPRFKINSKICFYDGTRKFRFSSIFGVNEEMGRTKY